MVKKVTVPVVLVLSFSIGWTLPLAADCCCPGNPNDAYYYWRLAATCNHNRQESGCSEMNPVCITVSCANCYAGGGSNFSWCGTSLDCDLALAGFAQDCTAISCW